MTAISINGAELQALRTIARHAEEVEGYRMMVAREDAVGTGDLTYKVTRLMEASLKLDGMVAVAESSGLFSRAGFEIRRMVLAGREPNEADFPLGAVPIFYSGS